MKTRLELAAVSKRFGAVPVLAQAWLQVRGGEAVGLVGAHRARKTTQHPNTPRRVYPPAGAVWVTTRRGSFR